jgi:hypothetical protein
VGLFPNQVYHYRIAASNANGASHGEELKFKTPAVQPRIVGEPSASFAKPTSAVLFGELNPENAETEYFFEYAPSEEALTGCPGVKLASCPGAQATPAGHSSVYGRIGVTEEAVGLQPETTYRYRLVATNEVDHQGKREGGVAVGPEGTFTTAPAPKVSAATGPPNSITATSAIVSGRVNPDGQPATYTFELGVYNPAGTQYGVVSSGATGSSTLPVEETLALTGLQPGTTYAYRITVHSGYGEAIGATETFTTLGLPSVLEVPGVLGKLTFGHPPFPAAPTVKTKCKKGFRLDKSGKCVATRKKRRLRRHRAKKKK